MGGGTRFKNGQASLLSFLQKGSGDANTFADLSHPEKPMGTAVTDGRGETNEDSDNKDLTKYCGELMVRKEKMKSLKWEADIEEYRSMLRSLERKMESFGFDARRGLETYSVQEIKNLARKNGFSKEFLMTLDKCLREHVEFYTTLHTKTSEPLLVEREMPEKTIQAIQEWLTHFRRGIPNKVREPITSVLSRRFLIELEQVQDPSQLEEWYEELGKLYKREYDIYRFADLLARLYNEYAKSETLAPDQHALARSAKKILHKVAEKRLEDSNFFEFLSKRMIINSRAPAVCSKERNVREAIRCQDG